MGDFSIEETAFAVKLQTLEFASFLILDQNMCQSNGQSFYPKANPVTEEWVQNELTFAAN